VSHVDFSRLTAIVHASDRPHSLDRLVRSIHWVHPELRILVAQDSGPARTLAGADVVRLPKEVGVSACRNALLARVRTPYFLLLEDSLELNRRSGVDRLLGAAASGQLDIAAGELTRCQKRLVLFTRRTPEQAAATFEFDADAVKIKRGHRPGANGFLGCDVTANFFVGRTDKVRAIGGWDAQLQFDERIEFFYRACRYGLKVGVSPEATALRWIERGGSQPLRDYTGLAVAKMGVSRMVDAEGRIHEAMAETRRAA
jgi:hypothetical protein